MEKQIPKFVTINTLAKEGILSEYCLRQMLKRGELPAIYSGKKALINYDIFMNSLNSLPSFKGV